MSVDDADVGGEVVILRSVLDMLNRISSRLKQRCISLWNLNTAGLIEQEKNRKRAQSINHSCRLTSPHPKWRCLTRGDLNLTSLLLCVYAVQELASPKGYANQVQVNKKLRHSRG